MYRISKKKRLYSPTPIVKVTMDEEGKEKEEIVLVSTLRTKEGNSLSEKVVEFLNTL